MSRPLCPRRVALTLLLAVWLSVQSLVLGISPAWGFVLPHTHIVNGSMTAADWQAHARAHRLGIHSGVVSGGQCDRNGTTEGSTVHVTSLPDPEGSFSLLSLFHATATMHRIAIPAFAEKSTRHVTHSFFAAELFFPPALPPPNV